MCEPLKSSGTVCIQDSECDYGLGCQGTTGSRVCGALPAIGQPCNVDGVCRDEGAYCDFNANMCKMYLQEGAQCGTAGSTCSLYYPCDFTATTPVCKQGPGVGQMCSSSTRCFDANTYCNFNQSPAVCAELKADGAFCGSGEECLSRNCDFEQQICASPMACL
jgi:hypothetical protein